MAVARRMGPERVCPEEPGPPEAPEGAAGWSGDEEDEEEEEGEEEEEEEEGGGGYLYQPLSQEPEQGPAEPGPPAGSAEPGPGLQERLQMLRLHLPEPPADSEDEEEEEEEEEGAAARSIPMDPEHVELVKRTMAAVKLPTLGIPAWASQISDEQWQAVVQRALQARHGVGSSRPEWK
ncbi:hypothetical protein ASZ78_016330 [Callipepla squamata]|uniref:Male-enhanced antigen 1 n=1 Tax=Callipepla squamata TaxID=9009 RepID=A0A226MIR4_CALSU|nr:hypothetical protein ASZ78_016330 [Callipepla squamata]